MPIDLAKTLTLADITNKIVVALAVLCAGIWALFKFVVQDSPTAQLAHDRIKRACSERGSLDVKLESKSTDKMILGTVSLKNIGTREVVLEFDDPISVAELTFPSDGRPRASRFIAVGFPFAAENKLIPWHNPSILPGRTMELNFAASVGQPGTYLISFNGGRRQILPDDSACPNVPAQAAPPAKDWFWAATAIQQVPEAAKAGRGELLQPQR